MEYFCLIILTIYLSYVQYASGDIVDCKNEASYTRKTLHKLQNGALTIFTSKDYMCPFDKMPENGEKGALIAHATSQAIVGKNAMVRASHRALLTYLIGDADPYLPKDNAAHHQHRRPSSKARKQMKLQGAFGAK